jgi:small-conductance mechanosensitive channel
MANETIILNQAANSGGIGLFDFSGIYKFILDNNTQNNFLIALGIFAGLFIVFKLFDSVFVYILKKATKKTKWAWDDFVVDFLESINWFFFAYLAFYIGAISLNLPDIINKALNIILFIFIAFYAANGISSVVSRGLDRYKETRKKKNKEASESMINVLKFLSKIIIWIVAFLMILTNLGINITPLIAGFGIGGIAIGLALQNILGDLFSAFAIYFDKPFQEGDFIIVGNDMGVVKNIGIKTTRIQALGGQELIISNSELTSTRVNNYKKMDTRRVVFTFGVEYSTTNEQLKKVKRIVTEIIDKEEHAKLDRVNFSQFGDSSLNFEVVYYVDTNDYNIYMDVQERINLEIKRRLENEKIGFAFPSRTVYMRKED